MVVIRCVFFSLLLPRIIHMLAGLCALAGKQQNQKKHSFKISGATKKKLKFTAISK